MIMRLCSRSKKKPTVGLIGNNFFLFIFMHPSKNLKGIGINGDKKRWLYLFYPC